MILVHQEPLDIQREFGGLCERCEFCNAPTRYWTADAQHTVCQRCAESHSLSDLKKLCPTGKKMEKLWTVVRFPNGSWSYGGKPSDPDYEECEIWQIEATSAEKAVRKAQAKRRRNRKKSASLGVG